VPVPDRQNTDDALLFMCAARRRYATARRWRSLRIAVALMIGIAGPVVASVASGADVYVAAAAALWTVVSRVLSVVEQQVRSEAVRAQEKFDTHVFGIAWNDTATGDEPSREELEDWSRRETARPTDWYPPNLVTLPDGAAILLCQRASVNWSRRDHQVYRFVVLGLAGLIGVGPVIYALVADLSLADYLLRWAIPLLPTILVVVDAAIERHHLASEEYRVEKSVHALLDQIKQTGTTPSLSDCRRVQDEIVAMRLLPGVPNWWYRLTRARRERAMQAAAQGYAREILDALPAGPGHPDGTPRAAT
jgi:hypothetical protein